MPNILGSVSIRRRSASAVAAALCVGLIAACGSGGTKTVSVANTATPPAPASTTTTSTSTSSTASPSPSSSSSAPVTTTTGSSSGSVFTRTQSGPAFAQTTTASGPSGPDAEVVAHGYTPVSPNTYNPQNTLQVIIAANPSGGQKAFFFVNGNYIGTDTSLPSSAISLVDASDTEVTLGYALVHPDGSSAGVAQVRYALNNGQLGPLDPIPSASPLAAVSRR